MNSRTREVLIGAAVVMVGAAMLVHSYGRTGRADVNGYDLVARFDKADGLGIGGDVRLSGVKVGRVTGQKLDDRYRAVITMRVAGQVALPEDSAALIQTDGLLGAKYIALQPGADDANLTPGQELRYTQGAVNVQDLLDLIISQAEAKRGGPAKTEGAANEPK